MQNPAKKIMSLVEYYQKRKALEKQEIQTIVNEIDIGDESECNT